MVYKGSSSYKIQREMIYSNSEGLDEIRIICIYRYVSVVITSLYYMISEIESDISIKLGVVLSILLAAKIITELYVKYNSNKVFLTLLVFTETLGISLVLFSTYGIRSPFILYALNPVIVAASFLPAYFCWANLLVCLISSFSVSFLFFNLENESFSMMLSENVYTAAVLISVTLAVQLLSNLIRRLRAQAQELKDERTELSYANSVLEHAQAGLQNSMDHIMSLYQAIEVFTNQDSLEGFCKMFADYGSKLTDSNFSFFWVDKSNDHGELIASNIDAQKTYENLLAEIVKEMKTFAENQAEMIKPIKIQIGKHSIMLVTVKSASRVYGVLGIEIDYKKTNIFDTQYERQLSFLSDLSGIILERFHLEEVVNSITLTEEQNRIANEIHDSVSQKMFSISCASHALKCKWTSMSAKDIEEQLELLSTASNTAMSELRTVIYGLSTKKKDESLFMLSIKKYLNEFSKLNGIFLDLCFKGDEHVLSGSLKKVLYRVICEACGNSARHGECTSLKVNLEINANYTELTIVDNGKGFVIKDISEESKGLGIYNMMKMIEALNGKFSISSDMGSGTKILITVPNRTYKQETGEVAI